MVWKPQAQVNKNILLLLLILNQPEYIFKKVIKLLEEVKRV